MSRILVVDGEKNIRITVGDILRVAGYDAIAAENVDAARAILEEETIDVIIGGILAAKGTGIELFKSAKSAAANIQFIVMAGEPNAETASGAAREGAFDYLVKPVTKEALLKTVQSAVRMKELADGRCRLEEENRAHKKNLDRLKAIFDNMTVSSVVIGRDGVIESVNKAALEMFGYTSGELLGQSVKMLMPEPRRGGLDQCLASWLRREKGAEAEALGKDSLVIPIELTVREAGSGAKVIFAEFIRDRQERRAVEKVERDRQDRLVSAGEMASLEILISKKAHEINNPNHLIRLSVSQLERMLESLEPVLAQFVRENGDFSLGGLPYTEACDEIPIAVNAIRSASDRIAALVKELKDLPGSGEGE